jgi:ribosomal protein S7
MCWAVGKGYKIPLIFVKGNLNGETYREKFKNNHIFEKIWETKSENDARFQQDGTSCHAAKKTVKVIEEQMTLVEWWPNLPGISVLENVLAILKRKVYERVPKDMPSLEAAFREEWEAISQDMLDNLMESAPSRLRNARSVGHMFNQMRRMAQEDPVRELPVGFIVTRKVTFREIGQVMKVIGTVVKHTQINYRMPEDLANLARSIVYNAIECVNEKIGKGDPIDLLLRALENSDPKVEVKSRRVGSATYQIPVEIPYERQHALVFRWMIELAQTREGLPWTRPCRKKLWTPIIILVPL